MAKDNKATEDSVQPVESQVDNQGAGETTFSNDPQPQEGISLTDLDRVAQIIDLASQRGAFRGNELQFVGEIYNKLFRFLSAVRAEQEARAENESGAEEEVAPESGE